MIINIVLTGLAFKRRILGPDGSTPYEYENVSEVIINPETGEAEEVVVYITGPAPRPRLAA